MPVPGVVPADLVVVQTDLAFCGLEALLDRPRVPATWIRSSFLAAGWAEAQVVGRVRGVGDAASDQQPVAVTVVSAGQVARAQS